MKQIRMLVAASISIGVLPVYAGNFDSSYTSVKEKDCTTLETHEAGSVQSCPKFGDIKVKVIEGDLRQTITLNRKGTDYPLNFLETVSANWSELGPKIEWRYKTGKSGNPVGIIVRLNVSENPEKPQKKTSYLVVSKITTDNICVVGKVSPQSNQNQKARTMAEQSADMSCLNAKASAKMDTINPATPKGCTLIKTSLAPLVPSPLRETVAAYNGDWPWLTKGTMTCMITATKGLAVDQGPEVAKAITAQWQGVGFKYTDGADAHEGTVQVWKKPGVRCLLSVSYIGETKDIDSVVVACQ